MAKRIDIVSELNDLKTLQPFKKFTIVMASGDRYTVQDAEEILVFRSTATLFPLDRGGHVFLHLKQISSVEAYDRP